jgi:hypothetical protein
MLLANRHQPTNNTNSGLLCIENRGSKITCNNLLTKEKDKLEMKETPLPCHVMSCLIFLMVGLTIFDI